MGLTKSYLKDLTYKINNCCIEVHKALGPGLLETVYHKCVVQELINQKMRFASQLKIPINYKGLEVNAELRCDLLIEEAIVVELKAVEQILPIHKMQLYTYMKLLNKPKGILINFNVTNLYHVGQETLVNELFRQLPE
jgi:GxxExxY protein